jgi:hypothetical protein
MSIAAGLLQGFATGRNVREDKKLRERELSVMEADLARSAETRAAPQDYVPRDGGTGGPAADAGGDWGWDAGLPASLVRSESGGNFGARNDVMGAGGRGHFGRGQFSHARLQDAARAGVIPAGMDPQAFLADPQAQARVEQWHTADIGRRIKRGGLDRYVGQEINGVRVTPQGMMAVAHLGGFGGLQRFLETQGRYNPSDANGTSLLAYLRQHGGGERQARPGGAQPRQPISVRDDGDQQQRQPFEWFRTNVEGI